MSCFWLSDIIIEILLLLISQLVGHLGIVKDGESGSVILICIHDTHSAAFIVVVWRVLFVIALVVVVIVVHILIKLVLHFVEIS